MAKRNFLRRTAGLTYDPTYNTTPVPTTEANTTRYLTLAKAVRAGERLTDDDMYFLLKYNLGAVDENKLKDLTDRYNAGIKDASKRLSSEDTGLLLEEMKKSLTSPAYKQQMLTALKKAEIEDATGKLRGAMEVAIGATNLGVGAKQLQAYNRLSKESVKPAAPGLPGEAPDFQAARRAVQQAVYQPSIAQKSAEAESKAIYQSELQNAKTAAGGQAGAYGALSQVAATRRGRRAAELAPQIANIEAQNRANLINFGQQAQGLEQQRFSNQANLYQQQLQNYGQQQQALGGLRAAGEQNILGATTGLLQNVPNIAGNRRIEQKYNTLRNQLYGIGLPEDQINKFSDVYSSLNQRTAANLAAPGQFTDVYRPSGIPSQTDYLNYMSQGFSPEGY